MDDQTLQGKLPAVVARRSGRRPVIAVVGRRALSTYAQRFNTRAKARFAVAEYIGIFYNRNGCTHTCAIAPRPKPLPSTRPEQRPDHHNHQELSEIL